MERWDACPCKSRQLHIPSSSSQLPSLPDHLLAGDPHSRGEKANTALGNMVVMWADLALRQAGPWWHKDVLHPEHLKTLCSPLPTCTEPQSGGPVAQGCPLLFLQVLGSELKAQQPLLIEAEQGLQQAKKCSGTLASQFQEHCPDIERQETELQRLNQRFGTLNKQIEHRSGVDSTF